MEYSIENILEKAFLTAAKINQANARGRVLTQIADAYIQHKDRINSEIVLTAALKAADSIKYPHEKAKLSAAIAAVMLKNGQVDKAREQFTRAINLAHASESPAQSIEALYRVASQYMDSKYNSEAVKLLEELRKVAMDPESEVDSAAELVNIAELYDDLDNKEAASGVLAEALAIAEKIPDNWFRLERLIEIADTYATIGETEKSLPILDEAALLVVKVEEYSRPYFLLRMAEVYICLNKAEAIEILKFIPASISSDETAYDKAGSLVEVAAKYLEIAENVAAVALLVQAIVLSENITDPKEKIAIQIEIAEWLDEAGHLDEAIKLASQAYAACQNLTDKKSSIFSLGNLALLYVYLKNPDRAGQIVDDIIRIVKETAAKTSGLGAIGEELAAEGQPGLALRLADIIKEPEIQSQTLVKIVEYLI